MGNIQTENSRDFTLEPCTLFDGCHLWKVGEAVKKIKNNGRAIKMGIKGRGLREINFF